MTFNKLQGLREAMKLKQIAAYIIPTADPHKSEYIAEYWKVREWLTEFTGSAGTAVITKKHAGLWTDSRYFIQAEHQLLAPFVLHKLKTRQPEYQEWLMENLEFGDAVGIDGRLFSASEIESFTTKLKSKQIRILDVGDLCNDIWKNRTELPSDKIIEHPVNYCGETRTSKIERVRQYLKENNYTQTIITALDDVAWLLNIRGSDIEYNPVVTAYCYISLNNTVIFIDEKKISDEIRVQFKKNKITIQPYYNIADFLTNLQGYSSILSDKNSLNYALSKSVPIQCKIVSEPSIINKYKSVKNDTEIENYHQAQIRDGIVMCNFLQWLEENIKNSDITEHIAALKTENFRSVQDNYMGLSFEPISAYQENAALPHYSANENDCKILKQEGLYLIDSGAQYIDGTTDITRTVSLGKVTKEQKTNFTLVLKGHIRLAKATFPKGTKGFHLDTLSRLDLWENGKDFGHGTGHGIGFFLNVHEGPQGFSQAINGTASTEFEPGMLTTNEPGFYLEGKYGIRIENVLLCELDKKSDEQEFYRFKVMTYCPIDKHLIDISLLTQEEIEWVNNYHKLVFNLLSPLACKEILPWLKEKTSALK